MHLCELGCVCVYTVHVCMHALVSVCARGRESWRGKGRSLGFSLRQKQTVHKEGLPLSHFNANESDSVRGVKELSWGLATTATGVTVTHAHACTPTSKTQTCARARTHTNGEGERPR